MVVKFELNGAVFSGIRMPRPPFQIFTEAISYVVECETQRGNRLITGLSCPKGVSEIECGWLKDKFGLSWQIVPAILGKLMSDPQKIRPG